MLNIQYCPIKYNFMYTYFTLRQKKIWNGAIILTVFTHHIEKCELRGILIFYIALIYFSSSFIILLLYYNNVLLVSSILDY